MIDPAWLTATVDPAWLTATVDPAGCRKKTTV